MIPSQNRDKADLPGGELFRSGCDPGPVQLELQLSFSVFLQIDKAAGKACELLHEVGCPKVLFPPLPFVQLSEASASEKGHVME